MRKVIYSKAAVVFAKSVALVLLLSILRLEESESDLSSSVLLVLTFTESLKRLVYYGMPSLFINANHLSKSSSYLQLMFKTGYGRYSAIHLFAAFFLPVLALHVSGRMANVPLGFIVESLAVLVLVDVSFACHTLALKAKFAGKPNLSMVLSDLWILVSVLIAALFWNVFNLVYLPPAYSVCFVILVAAVLASVGLHCLVFADYALSPSSCNKWLRAISVDLPRINKRSIVAGITNFLVTEGLKWAPYMTAFILLREESSLSINLATRIAALILIPLMAVNIKNTHMYSQLVQQGDYKGLSLLIASEVRYLRKLLAPAMLIGFFAYATSIHFLSVNITLKESLIVMLIFASAAVNAYSGPTAIVLGLRLETFKKATIGLVFIGLAFIAASVAIYIALTAFFVHGVIINFSVYAYIISGLSLICTMAYQINQWMLLKKTLMCHLMDICECHTSLPERVR